MKDSIKELAEEWLRLDKDSTTRDQIYHLLVKDEQEELQRRLAPRIAFGTAGLRGPMQAGFACLNSLTVIQASQGLAAYLLDTETDVHHRGVVIGRDARHNSDKFAKLTAAAFVAKGIKVWWFEQPVHTPLVPFGVSELRAAAGVMITASHNPAQDNGYKVYWSNGCQIIPPHDAGIAASIMKNLEPVTWDTSVVDEGNLLVESTYGLVRDAYFRAVSAGARSAEPADAEKHPTRVSDISFVYTPMHGVGLPYMARAVRDLGLEKNMVVVPEQADPDPDFPTVRFPNPEEKGALDLAIQTADAHSIQLVIASDPDADRLAVVEKVEDEWHQLTGNQLGILLASHIFDTWRFLHSEIEKLAMLASTVSSQMLAVMAKTEGFHFEETLTGFKWLGNMALKLDERGYDSRFAFEEAIGYMIPGVVKDKDAISAAAVFLTAVARWRDEEGLTPWMKLQQLYQKYGYFEDANTYLVSPSRAVTDAVFADIRKLGTPYPTQLGKRKILRWRDLTEGYDSATEDHKPVLPVSKESQMITCELEGQVRFTARGSGTEPKLKLYIECRAESSAKARKGANEVLEDLLEEWFKPASYGLRLA
ncbi:hypothetical protein H2201_002059 [Coniosporium apollinis]|uniref:Phosphoglucomutase n=2 Tax=Coniosporium TaxID=2810619 RepID=A0ABQ9P0S7_9PEZI|nr:hypothetical protein H2199_000891 [Cladosporium sp. JES 115]KAJ9667873.1 hypothetical protein H2201_002059 [Coniosporium apollinis]